MPGGPGREAQPGLDGPEGERRPGDAQGQRRCQGRAGGDPLRFGLGVRDRAVAVGVDPELLLERRDLGLVHDDVEEDAVRLDPDPGVVVDREVAQRMGEGDGRQDDRQGDPDDRCARPALERHRGPSGVGRGWAAIIPAW